MFSTLLQHPSLVQLYFFYFGFYFNLSFTLCLLFSHSLHFAPNLIWFIYVYLYGLTCIIVFSKYKFGNKLKLPCVQKFARAQDVFEQWTLPSFSNCFNSLLQSSPLLISTIYVASRTPRSCV